MRRAVRPVTTFGPPWTRLLIDGAASLHVPCEWVLAVLALESGFNPLARNASGARGLWQRMPRDGVPYAETDPTRQLADAFAFWRQMLAAFRVGAPTSREAFYCLNLAPARLKDGRYNDDTVLYAAPGAAYRANAAPFGLDPEDPVGRLRMRDLASGLDAAVRRCRARYDAELGAARDRQMWDDAAPDMRNPDLSELD